MMYFFKRLERAARGYGLSFADELPGGSPAVETPPATPPAATPPPAAPEELALGDEFNEESFRAEIEKRGLKNVHAELKRKSDEAKALKAELEKSKAAPVAPAVPAAPAAAAKPPSDKSLFEFLKSNEKGKAIIEGMKALNLEEKDVKAFVDLMDLASEAKTNSMLGKHLEKFYKEDLNTSLKTLEADPKMKFAISKYGDKLEARLIKEEIAPEFWGNTKLIENVLKAVAFEEMANDTTTPAREQVPPVEPKGAAGAGTGGGTSDAEAKTYAEHHGLVFETAEDKASVRNIMKNEAELEKTYQEKIYGGK